LHIDVFSKAQLITPSKNLLCKKTAHFVILSVVKRMRQLAFKIRSKAWIEVQISVKLVTFHPALI